MQFQEEKPINKKVKVGGEVITVKFSKENYTKETIILDEKLRKGINRGTWDYVINGSRYVVAWSCKFCGYDFSSKRLDFEGFSCGDSEKKMIEHILQKHGV